MDIRKVKKLIELIDETGVAEIDDILKPGIVEESQHIGWGFDHHRLVTQLQPTRSFKSDGTSVLFSASYRTHAWDLKSCACRSGEGFISTP